MSQELSANGRLSHYRILSKIGAGGRGEVYRARDTRLDRKVALKLLPAEFTQDADRMRRLMQEAKAAAAGNAQVEAENCFHKAIEIAQQQSAKSWELRAAKSRARLWQQQGKIGEARHMLAEIYRWFTAGFDTADLKEAKALLNELQ